MRRSMIGQVLCRMGKINAMDVEEILVDQAVTRRRFGEVAMSWGLCEPQDVRDAWLAQLTEGEEVDLGRVEVDMEAARCLPAEISRRLGLLPLRNLGSQLVVARSRPMDSVELAEVVRSSGKDVLFVEANEGQLVEAIERWYPMAA